MRSIRLWVAALVVAAMFGPAIAGGAQSASEPRGSAVNAQASVQSARTCFERARKLGFPAAGQTEPYVLQAEFTTRASSGEVETGTYTDTWLSDTKWRREAILGKSRFARSRNGKKLYRLNQGPDAALLQFVLTAMEPIPASDSVDESEWKIAADTVDGVAAIRVSRMEKDSDGAPGMQKYESYWFDDSGQLVKTSLNALQTQPGQFEEFNGVRVARKIDVLLGAKVGMKIKVTQLGPANGVDKRIFTMKGHDWDRQFTSEVR